jgi:hypothetical protein
MAGKNVGQFVGTISDVNIWTNILLKSDVNLMSAGCGEQLINAYLTWDIFRYSFVGNLTKKRPATCKDRKGKMAQFHC